LLVEPLPDKGKAEATQPAAVWFQPLPACNAAENGAAEGVRAAEFIGTRKRAIARAEFFV